MIIPEQYINIGGVDMSDDIYPNYYKLANILLSKGIL